MPDETTIANSETWKIAALVFSVLGLGQLGRTLKQKEPINWRVFAGEMCLTAVFAITLIALGILENMSFWQIVFVGGMAGLGGVKSLETVFQIYNKIKTPR